MKKFITFIIIIIFINIIFPTKVGAQDSFSLSVYPPILEVTSKPGQTITQTYKIGNESDKDIGVVIQLVSFKPVGEDGSIQLSLEKLTPDRAINWFTIEGPHELDQLFLIKAGQNQEVVLKIQVPPDAAYKDYYYSLLVRTNPQITSRGLTRSIISAAVGSHILLTVSAADQKKTDLQIAHFGLGKFLLPNLVDSFDDVSFEAIIKNMGKHFAKTEGQIIVTGVIGQTRQKLALLPLNVLTFSSRRASCVDSPDCRLPRYPILGRFQAKLVLSFAEGQRQELQFYFYVLPVKLGGFILAAIILALGLPKMIRLVIKRDSKR